VHTNVSVVELRLAACYIRAELYVGVFLQQHLSLSPGPIAINSLVYNHNGQLLLTGAADGRVRLYGQSCSLYGLLCSLNVSYVVSVARRYLYGLLQFQLVKLVSFYIAIVFVKCL